MWRNRLAMVVACLAACGGDDDGGAGADAAIDSPAASCGTAGSGEVNGTITGAGIDPVVRAQQFAVPGLGVVIVLDEVAGACGEAGESGEHLVLAFCDAPAVGAHTVVGEQAFACPGTGAAGLVEQNGGADYAEGLDGTVTILSRDPGCVQGTFDISFMPAAGPGTPESLSGSFNAVVCP